MSLDPDLHNIEHYIIESTVQYYVSHVFCRLYIDVMHRLYRGQVLLGNALHITASLFDVTNYTSEYPLISVSFYIDLDIQKLSELLINWLEKIHLVRNKEVTISRVTGVLDTFHTAFLDLMHSPGQILLQFACSTASMLGLFSTVIFVYHALGMSGTPWYQLLTLSSLLFISASYTPLPGASGAQEGGFLLYFQGIFKEGTIGLALLIWRFFTFYLFLIVGVFTILLEKMILRREAKKKQAAEERSGD